MSMNLTLLHDLTDTVRSITAFRAVQKETEICFN